MKEKFHWLILYDIKDIKRLRRVSKIMESYGWRVQKSVFESDAEESVIQILKSRLLKEIDEEEDFILFFNLCEKDWQLKECYGKSGENEIQDARYLIL